MALVAVQETAALAMQAWEPIPRLLVPLQVWEPIPMLQVLL